MNDDVMSAVDRPRAAAPGTTRWGSDVIAAMLRALDVEFIALTPGASFRGLHDSLVNHLGNTRPEMLLALHEEHAVAMAHGYARVTGRPMAVALHSNVGLMHATMAIFNAWCDRVPILMLGGVGPMDAVQRRPWVDWIHTARDLGALVRGYTKWDDQPASVGAALEAMVRAHQIAMTAPKGPVYVCLDASIQEQVVERAFALPPLERFRPALMAEPPADISMLANVANNHSFFNDELHQERTARVRDRPVENRWIGMRMSDPPLNLAHLAEGQGAIGLGPVDSVDGYSALLASAIAQVKAGATCVIDVHVAAEYARAVSSALLRRIPDERTRAKPGPVNRQ